MDGLCNVTVSAKISGCIAVIFVLSCGSDYLQVSVTPRDCSDQVAYRYPRAVWPYLVSGATEAELEESEQGAAILVHEACSPEPPQHLSNCDLERALAPLILAQEPSADADVSLPAGYRPFPSSSQSSREGTFVREIYGKKVAVWDHFTIYHGYGYNLNKPGTRVYLVAGYKPASIAEAQCD